MGTQRLRINAPRVIAEAIDGEVVAIDLATGTYFSLRGSAYEVWTAAAVGAGVDEVADRLRAIYGEVPDADVAAFVDELIAAELLVADDGETERHPLDAPTAGASYEPPVLESFTDMQDVILLDPVHEVDPEQGWPRRR
jgi:hypothetical protein